MTAMTQCLPSIPKWKRPQEDEPVFEQLDALNQLYGMSKSLTDADQALLREIPYDEFLRSDYWQFLRRYMLAVHKSCVLCGASHHLQVHHRRYDRRGFEHHAPERELTVLCDACHGKFHTGGSPSKSADFDVSHAEKWSWRSAREAATRGSVVALLFLLPTVTVLLLGSAIVFLGFSLDDWWGRAAGVAATLAVGAFVAWFYTCRVFRPRQQFPLTVWLDCLCEWLDSHVNDSSPIGEGLVYVPPKPR